VISKDKNLKGLVLAGGKSSRMKEDKGRMNWHGKEQRYYVADMLRKFCSEVYISCRKEQAASVSPEYKIITDNYDAGPLGAIVTAMEQDPSSAWLVLACDLPLLDTSTIAYLVENRNPGVMATTYKSPFDDLPEPLVTIWEPKAFPVFKQYVSEHKTCPRKILLNHPVQLLHARDASKLLNANTPEDAEKVRGLLNGKYIIN